MIKEKFSRDFRKFFIFGSGEWIIKLYMHVNPYLGKGCIIDIETTGLWPADSSILTLGIWQGDLIRIYQLAKPDYERFTQACRIIVERSSKPRYAYVARFEQQFLGIPEGWQDLTRYREIDYDQWRPWQSSRYRLADITRNPCENREDWDIDSSEIPATWEKWLTTRDPRVLAEIPYHNYIDILRERQLV